MKHTVLRDFDGLLATPEDVHESLAKPVGTAQPSRLRHRRAARVLRAIANEDRFRILCHLSDADATVTVMAEELKLSQPAVSQHLAKLRSADLVVYRQNAKHRVYALRGPSTVALMAAIRQRFKV